MDLLLTEQQAEVQGLARRFAEARVLPRAAMIDGEDAFPRDLWDGMAGLGLFGMCLPEDQGGSGFDTVCFALAMEEIARCSGAAGNIFAIPVEAVLMLHAHGGEAHAWMIPEIVAGRLIPATAVSEPGGGSDVAAMTTSARRTDRGWAISGTKAWLSLGLVADTITVFAKTAPEKGHRGITAFVVRAGTPGLTLGRKEPLLGMRGLETCQLTLDAVEVRDEARLGPVDGAFKMAMETFNVGRIAMASMALGMARSALEDSLAWAKQRQQFGKPIFEHQGVQFMLADMARDVTAARLLIHQAAKLRDAGQNFAQAAAIAKLFTTDMAMLHATNAVQIHGGYGYSRDLRLERIFRDVKLAQIYEGTNQIQRVIIARGAAAAGTA